jgi:cell division septation protein DedD
MEESTSWKGHSFTLLIFGGIVVLCSIFFVLGMVIGRTQGQRIAEVAMAEKAKRQPRVKTAADEFKLDFYDETTEDKPDLKLQPAPAPPPPPKPAAAPPTPAATPTKPASKATPAVKETFLQVAAAKDEKQAAAELKRIESKGFKATIVIFTDKEKGKVHRIYVGPYRDSEIDLAKSDLRAKGYKDVIVRR